MSMSKSIYLMKYLIMFKDCGRLTNNIKYQNITIIRKHGGNSI